MNEVVLSKNSVPVRLTDERWSHIAEEHCELDEMRQEVLETVADPSLLFAGHHGEFLAVREIGMEKYLVVVYRELEKDGFVITAFLTSRVGYLRKRKLLWTK